MVRLIGSLALGAALIVVGAGSAGAQTYMNMKGTWIGTGEAIVDGPSAHHLPTDPAKPAATFRLRHQAFTYKIEGQDGRRFWGSIASEHVTERLIGSLSANGKAVYMAGHQGLLDGEVIDADTIQMCYREASPTLAVVGCNEMKRQK